MREPHLTACLARTVRFLREGHGWTQSDLAEKSGVSRRSLVKIENTPIRSNSRVLTSVIDRLAGVAEVSSGVLTLTPEVLSMIGGVDIRPPAQRRALLSAYSREVEFPRRSRDYIVMAQGGDPARLFYSTRDATDGP